MVKKLNELIKSEPSCGCPCGLPGERVQASGIIACDINTSCELCITLEQINSLKHTLGFFDSIPVTPVFSTSRNRYVSDKPIPHMEGLCTAGLMSRQENKGNEYLKVLYTVTDKGVQYLENVLTVKIDGGRAEEADK